MNSFSVTPEMAARYVANRHKEIDLLKESLLKKDFSMIAGKAHNLKGTAESFGFPELGVIGEELEVAALGQQEAAVQEQISRIETWLKTSAPK